MGDRKNRLVRPAALSAVAIASLVGAPSASAQEECLPTTPCGGSGSAAFGKLLALGFPGNTELVFSKQVEGKEIAFLKIRELDFPGGTEAVFSKWYKERLP
jgi:hypothetical protein